MNINITTIISIVAALYAAYRIWKFVFKNSLSYRREPEDSLIYVSFETINKLIEFRNTVKSGNHPKAGTLHPGWSTSGVIDSLRSSRIIATNKHHKSISYTGAWIMPEGWALVVPQDKDRDEVLKEYMNVVKLGRLEEFIYLSREDVRSLIQNGFYYNYNRKCHIREVALRYPGWTWEELRDPLASGNHLHYTMPKGSIHSADDLPPGYIGVLISRKGMVLLDDGSLDHPARRASWSRNHSIRISEHCLTGRSSFSSPVIVHSPNASAHVPDSVRREFLLPISSELNTPAVVAVKDVIDRLRRHVSGYPTVTLVQATLSCMVFDPERSLTNEPMQSAGRGFVYEKHADGRNLRHKPTKDRLEWYKSQHQAYTESMSRIVQHTVNEFGFALIIDLHFYTKEPMYFEDSTKTRPELCVGIDATHTPPWLKDLVVSKFSIGFSVDINTPHTGSYVPETLRDSNIPVYSITLKFRDDVLARPYASVYIENQVRELASEAIEYLDKVHKSS
jgi:N-formylglutamate deformylase